MTRVNNSAKILGKVIKGPYEYRTKEGKLRVMYQVEIPARNKDKGKRTTPWVRSIGNQAEKDLANIKTGDMILVEGRIVTRTENKLFYIVEDPEVEDQMMIIDPEDEECPDYDDSEIKTIYVPRQVTEILADDVWYFHLFVMHLTDEERRRLFSEKLLKNMMAEMEKMKEYEEKDDDDDEEYINILD